MKEVTVIDACPGTGKTTYAIMMFNARGPKDKYLYITPYLDEVERIQDECPGFIQPMTIRDAQERSKETGKEVEVHPSIRHCKSKGEAIRQLAEDGQCITSTHSLFRHIDEETAELFRVHGYTLVMDEVLNPIEGMNAQKGEITALLEADVIRQGDPVKEGAKIFRAVPGEQAGFRRGYEDFRQIAKNGKLVLVDGKALVWLLPPDLLECFKDIYVMTYMFDLQPIAAYCQMFDIATVKKTLWDNRLVDYSEEVANSKLYGIVEKIDIHERGRINDIGNAPQALSKGWYGAGTKVKTEQLSANLYNFFHNHAKRPVDERMWTTYKAYRKKVEGDDEDKAKRFRDGFLANNIRATNDHQHKSAVAYCCNFHMNPYVKKFFVYGEVDHHEVEWALSEMLQWIWRSRIRTDRDIILYIPAKRMREAMKKWLNDVQKWTTGADEVAM